MTDDEPFFVSQELADQVRQKLADDGALPEGPMLLERLHMLGMLDMPRPGAYIISAAGWQSMAALIAMVALDREDIILPDAAAFPSHTISSACSWVQFRAAMETFLPEVDIDG